MALTLMLIMIHPVLAAACNVLPKRALGLSATLGSMCLRHHAVVMQGTHGRVSVYCPLTNVLLEASGSGPG
jgi:hypothetical protein